MANLDLCVSLMARAATQLACKTPSAPLVIRREVSILFFRAVFLALLPATPLCRSSLVSYHCVHTPPKPRPRRADLCPRRTHQQLSLCCQKEGTEFSFFRADPAERFAFKQTEKEPLGRVLGTRSPRLVTHDRRLTVGRRLKTAVLFTRALTLTLLLPFSLSIRSRRYRVAEIAQRSN